MNRNNLIWLTAAVFLPLFVLANIYYGAVEIPFKSVTQSLFGNGCGNSAWDYIIIQSRFPAAITAMITGAALGVCGLLLQTYFRNPLAGPSILGITSGANLAVAICILGFGFISEGFLTFYSMLGAMAIMFILIALGKIVRNSVTLLIVGILISYITNAVITLLNYYSSADGVQSLLIWGMGNFNAVGMKSLALYSILIAIGLFLSILLIKPLNAWMLGEMYAKNLGINLKSTRILILFTTGLLAAVTTAYCGPIAFVGLSMPHLSRMITKTDNHRILIPTSAICGALCTLICLFISTLPENGRLLPINALTPIFGVPLIIYVLIRKK